jgi:hypothetical protein
MIFTQHYGGSYSICQGQPPEEEYWEPFPDRALGIELYKEWVDQTLGFGLTIDPGKKRWILGFHITINNFDRRILFVAQWGDF